ncbi:MAG: hypothetical protein ACRD4Y_04790, partial [Candidatus Acidiferrales bacterium]
NYPPDLETLVNGVTVSTPVNEPAGLSASAVATASTGTAQQAAVTAPSPTSTSAAALPNKVRYLRRIPVDPMTGKPDWGLRSVQDDPDSDSWGGHDVFDVYSKSDGTAGDGTMYKDW